jgi:crossover junction endodeoxyribonuclease RuvC
MIKVMGVDPGLANCGVSIVEIGAQGEAVYTVEVFRSAPTPKKRKVLVADDNYRRAGELASFIQQRLELHRPAVIIAESMSFPRSSSAAAKMALCWGILASEAARRSLPLVQVSPQEIKKALCGTKSASKDDVQEALERRYSSQFEDFKLNVARTHQEHGFDSVGAVVASLDSEVLRMVRGMSRCEESTE